MPRDVILHLPLDPPPEERTPEEWLAPAAVELGGEVTALREVRVRRTNLHPRRAPLRGRGAPEARPGDGAAPARVRGGPAVAAMPPGNAPHVVVVGSGPAGLFAALDLLRAGLRVTVLERGKDVQARRRDIAALNKGTPADPESNYAFGEGGAGTYSDDKLYTRTGSRDAVEPVLAELVAHGAPPSILCWRGRFAGRPAPRVGCAPGRGWPS